ncbi:TIGR04282 family arsenosugar biosynthesis glycosyltransferase [Polaribacter cellanae]|uniref:DUF2064 domain-containing protein n=1 Tax=Polaribacter cellanae TaxID=2818493 RepID=A0A975H6P1_9FLAO|nr:DUF2064 domain-containing protein [Polaribacter cellanae]QTE22124.1 DUF2064 domain-containing protein [Polaribacter cellanae]
MIKKTAILIFANSAEKEAERKSFLSSEVFSALNNQTLKTVEKSGIEHFLFSEKEQIGNNFGERFSNAIETLFNRGFDTIITIGNDTPHLKVRHLLETETNLSSKDLVLGPSKDGGFYLMGIKKEHFNKKTFLKLPWQTSRLQKCIATISKSKNLEITFLEILNDIDQLEDIQLIINSFKKLSASILHLLKRCINPLKSFVFAPFFNIKKVFYSPNFNKGSPVIFA